MKINFAHSIGTHSLIFLFVITPQLFHAVTPVAIDNDVVGKKAVHCALHCAAVLVCMLQQTLL